MKKVTSLLLALLPLSLSSCFAINTSNSESTDTSVSTSTNATSSSTSTSSTTSTSETDYVEDDNTIIDTFSLDRRQLELKVGKQHSFLVNYTAKEGFNKDDIEFPFNWTSSNPSVATISQYGVCIAKASGQTKITCESVDGYRRASCTVYVYTSEDEINTEWQKVTSISDLDAGDLVIIGCPESGVAATKESTGMYLHSTNITYSSDKEQIASTGNAEQFMLDHDDEGWTFENEDGKYLATTHTGKVTFILKTGNVRWSLDYSSGYLDMRSTSNIDGWFMYNAKADKFTTYESNVQVDMFLITLYKQVRVLA